MRTSLSEKVTEQFYQWEKRGRGWLLADEPIELEPPHHPFFAFKTRDDAIDDGLRHTVFSRVANLFKPKDKPQYYDYPDYSLLEIFPSDPPNSLLAIHLSLTENVSVSSNQLEQFLVMLSFSTQAISFEIAATHTSIGIRFICWKDDFDFVSIQVKTYLKSCAIKVESACSITGLSLFRAAVDFGLKEECMRPILTTDKISLDPYTALLGMMNELQQDEEAVMQVLFTGTINPWSRTLVEAVSDGKGQSFFSDAPEMPALAKEKTSHPLFAVTVRLFIQSNCSSRAEALAQSMSYGLITATRSKFNSLTLLHCDDYDVERRMNDFDLRESHRMGMLLNSRELLTLVHLPKDVNAPKLFTKEARTKKPPQEANGHPTLLGISEHMGEDLLVTLSAEQRFRHIHLIGATGTGKSTLLFQLIYQDIVQGHGLAVLDPHGDLIEKIINHIPANRVNDVVVIDPSDTEHPVAFNILYAGSAIEKEILSSDLVAIFRRQATSWGDQMNSVLANTVLAFLESSEGGTLLDLRRFLVEKQFRNEFLTTVEDDEVHYFWEKQYPLLKTNSIGPILTRLDGFLRPKIIRNMVGQKRGLDFEHLINTNKIILIKLPQGLIGEENAYLLGSFLVTKIQQAAMARQVMERSERKNFFLYIDEFHHFATPSMNAILSGARKYHLGLTLAHQNLQQLKKGDGELENSVLSNAGTRVCFRLGDSDAKALEKGFSFFEAGDLQALRTGEAIVRIERSTADFSLKVKELTLVKEVHASREKVVAFSRKKYASPIPLQTPKKEDQEPHKTQVTEKKTVEKTPEAEIKTLSKFVEQEPARTNQPPTDPEPAPIEFLAPDEQNETALKEANQHRYLQTLIKTMGEAKGFRCYMEAPTPDGRGFVDVAIEKEGLRIACEVSVSSGAEWEVHNIEKGFAAGYDTVIICLIEGKDKARYWEAIALKFEKTLQKRINVFEIAELFNYLDELAPAPEIAQKLVKGYRVKVSYGGGSKAQIKKDVVTKVVAASLKRKKK